jgi:hypothetical protein
MPQGTRAAEVDALGVSAAATGVVWARDPDNCRADAPLLRERAETDSDDPLRVGRKRFSRRLTATTGFIATWMPLVGGGDGFKLAPR